MMTDNNDLTIVIQREAVTIADVSFATPPKIAELRELLQSASVREFRQGPAYLPALVFDELGVVIRFREDTGIVALVDVFFATSRKKQQPKEPFNGSVILNRQSLRRPVLMRELRRSGDFNFDDKLVPAASGIHGSQIGVAITPKFEYLGVLNFGWGVD